MPDNSTPTEHQGTHTGLPADHEVEQRVHEHHTQAPQESQAHDPLHYVGTPGSYEHRMAVDKRASFKLDSDKNIADSTKK